MHYRRDIDGLRALAVVPVVLYHAFPHALSGGYVGVDIFFVISGFLITGLLLADIDRSRYSLLQFYERRARRILPALVFMLLGTVLAASLLMLPIDFRALSASLLATGLFASNFYFWHASDYFDPAAETHPLLHTWSLAVEEQFYLFFPPLLALACWRWRRHLGWLLWATALGSLAVCLWWTRTQPESAFYLLPARAWELLLGSLLAAGAVPALRSQALASVLGFAGFGLIAFSLFAFDQQTAFPGYAALAPTLGAALIIYSGTQFTTPVGRLLSMRLPVGIGLISYSLYLWHWPVLALWRYYAITPLTAVQSMIAVLLAIALAVLSWKYVENPVRQRKILAGQNSMLTAALAVSLAVVVIGSIGFVTKGLPARLSPEIAELGSAEASIRLRAEDRERCVSVTAADVRGGDLCVIGRKTASPPEFLVWGDSHAETFRLPIAALAAPTGAWGYLVAGKGCPPLVGVRRYDVGARQHCADLNTETLQWIARAGVRKVILVARWPLNVTGEKFGAEAGEPPQWSPDGLSGNASVVEAGLRNTLAGLQKLGVQVFIVSGVPEIGLDVPRAMALERHFDRVLDFAPTRQTYLVRNASSLTLLDHLAAEFRSVTILHPHVLLCPGDRCLVEQAGQPLYCDDDHLSLRGAAFVQPALAPIFTAAPIPQS